MQNPTYEASPWASRPETSAALGVKPTPILSVGIKTITHNRSGLKLHPHPVIAIEMMAGDELASFDLTPSIARQYAKRLVEFADIIETKKAS